MVIHFLFGLRNRDRPVLVHFIILLVLPTVHNPFGVNVSSHLCWPNLRIPHDQIVQATYRTLRRHNQKNHHRRILFTLLPPQVQLPTGHWNHFSLCYNLLRIPIGNA